MLNPNNKNANLYWAYLKVHITEITVYLKEWSNSNNENFILVWDYFTAILITSYSEQYTITNN